MKKSLNPELKKISQDRIINIIAEDFSGSQQDFADACGLGKSSVSQYVNRTNSPGNMTSAKIGKALGLNPLWIMGFDVPKKITAKAEADKFRKTANEWNENHKLAPRISKEEFTVIRKLRFLDDRGKQTVLSTLEREYEFCKKSRGVMDSEEFLAAHGAVKLTDEQKETIEVWSDDNG